MNGNNPLVSVLIPSYNHEKYVQETINSIIDQTYQNIELIILDDGSKDATLEKIQEMKKACEKRFAKVHFETKPNEGTCTTLNKLISLATGKYVYLIASDDLSKPQAIEKEVEFLENNPDYVMVVGDNELIDSTSQKVGWDKDQNIVPFSEAFYHSFGEYMKSKKDFDVLSDKFGAYETLVRGNYIPNGYMIRKSAFDKIGSFTKDAPLEDWWLMLQLSKYGKLKYLDEILFSYRQHDNNTVKRRDYMIQISNQTLLYEEKLVNHFADKKWKALFEKNINQIKMKFNFFNLIKLYKVNNLKEKKKVLEIAGHQFIFQKNSL